MADDEPRQQEGGRGETETRRQGDKEIAPLVPLSPLRPFPLFRRSASCLLAACLLGGAVQLGVLWLTDVPLGVPGEWTWARTDVGWGDLLELFPAIVVGMLFLGFVAWGGRKIDRAGTLGRQLWACGLCLMGIAWLWSVISAVPGPAGNGRFPFVLYYPRTSGYFWQARYEVDDLGRFLAGYRESISDSDNPENYLHIGTHPPGLTAAFSLLIAATERWPRLASLAEMTQPQGVREAALIIQRNERQSGRDVRSADLAVLWLAALLVIFAAAGTSWSLFQLLQRSVGVRGAWWGAACWPLVPAVAIFLPKSDTLFPLLLVLIQWQWLESLDRGSLWRGLLAGGLFAAGMLLSLAFVPLALMLALQFAMRLFRPHRPAVSLWRPFVGAVLPVVLLVAACALCWRLNLLAVWLQNVQNHSSFYAHNPRTWLVWLWVNPLELSMAVGLPLAVLAGAGLLLMPTGRDSGSRGDPELGTSTNDPRRKPDLAPLLIALGVWAVLWLSGKNMGEAARLWVFLMPYVIWTAAVTLDRLSGSPRWLSVLLVVQMAVSLLTVTRIDGFHFGELLP